MALTDLLKNLDAKASRVNEARETYEAAKAASDTAFKELDAAIADVRELQTQVAETLGFVLGDGRTRQ